MAVASAASASATSSLEARLILDPFPLMCRPPRHKDSQDKTFTESLQVVAPNPRAEVSERERQAPGLITERGFSQAIALPESPDQHRRVLAVLAFLCA